MSGLGEAGSGLDAFALPLVGTQPTVDLRDILLREQERRCAYGTREGDGKTCDCKFYNPLLFNGSEANGCCEFRVAIQVLDRDRTTPMTRSERALAECEQQIELYEEPNLGRPRQRWTDHLVMLRIGRDVLTRHETDGIGGRIRCADCVYSYPCASAKPWLDLLAPEPTS